MQWPSVVIMWLTGSLLWWRLIHESLHFTEFWAALNAIYPVSGCGCVHPTHDGQAETVWMTLKDDNYDCQRQGVVHRTQTHTHTICTTHTHTHTHTVYALTHSLTHSLTTYTRVYITCCISKNCTSNHWIIEWITLALTNTNLNAIFTHYAHCMYILYMQM